MTVAFVGFFYQPFFFFFSRPNQHDQLFTSKQSEEIIVMCWQVKKIVLDYELEVDKGQVSSVSSSPEL